MMDTTTEESWQALDAQLRRRLSEDALADLELMARNNWRAGGHPVSLSAVELLRLLAEVRTARDLPCGMCHGAAEGPLAQGLLGYRETVCAACDGSGKRGAR